MRAIWKGAITFGLVNVPVKLYSATEDHDIGLHQVHDADGGRIRYQRKCEICGKVVDYAHIDKAYDDGERTVVLTPEDLEALPVERSREIDVVEFVPAEQIDPIMYEHAYYLEPDSTSIKSYALLLRTLEESDRVAIVNFSLRQRSRLGALRVRGDVLTLQALRWDDEVREATFPSLDEKVKITAKELEMSAALVESFESDFTPEKFTDEYQEQLQILIDAKLKEGDALDTAATFGETTADDEEEGEDAEVVDLMEVLRRSVERSRGTAGGSTKGASKGAASKKKPSKKGDSSTSTSRKKPATSSDDEAPAREKQRA
ncbi:Ku protein [Sanguibacter sp. 25GB23B1]|uniref:non-homologous end joining protein Ku n=1 Tax=unclassified Sanguibacter TaxID=2645534 RepID=UPI0032B01DF4